ncbi:MAG: hypothetical protein IPJ68_03185 [Candidatus Moraniibacteriota bacterium]|nr:MAG: hypothetical protein IPJ68_03185 [Candidatus Moranbacteria bacterium]
MHQKPLFLTIILITLLAVIAGAFWCLQNRPGAMNQPIVSEPVAQAPIQAETEKYPQHIETIPGNADEVWYNIPEMGIRMKLNREFAEDLIYIYSKSDGKITEGEKKFSTPFHETVHFSSHSLLGLEPACEPGTRAIGYFTKEAGDMKEWSTPSDFFIGRLQFTDFFIAFGIPTGEDVPTVPMCFHSDDSKWLRSEISSEEKNRIGNFIETQSVVLKKVFASVEEIR